MKITRYFPGFIETYPEENSVHEFNSVDELMEIPWVNKDRGANFAGLEISGIHLMAVYHNPYSRWVIGIFDAPYGLTIPKP